MKSRRFFNSLAQEKSQHWLVEKWMLDSSSGTMLHPDHDHADFLLVMGTNPHISNRGHKPTDALKSLARNENRTMVVVDPRITETSRQADRHLRVRPGTDVYLLLAMVKVIVEQDLGDAEFIANKTLGYQELKAQLADVDIADMAQRCGLEVADCRSHSHRIRHRQDGRVVVGPRGGDDAVLDPELLSDSSADCPDRQYGAPRRQCLHLEFEPAHAVTIGGTMSPNAPWLPALARSQP